MKLLLIPIIVGLIIGVSLVTLAFTSSATEDPIIQKAHSVVVFNTLYSETDFGVLMEFDLDIPKQGNEQIYPNSGSLTVFVTSNGTTHITDFLDIDTKKSTIDFTTLKTENSTQLNYQLYTKPNNLGETFFYNITAKKIQVNNGEFDVYEIVDHLLSKFNEDKTLDFEGHYKSNSLIIANRTS